ncbi:MAG: glutamate-5-semialdehyde dehydrogenase [bacterium]
MVNKSIVQIAQAAQYASRLLAKADSSLKNQALESMAGQLEAGQGEIIRANRQDLAAGREKGLGSALLDRLTLNEKRIKGMADALRQIIALPDPVGEIVDMKRQANGLEVGRMRTPIGVIGIIYESRPNVTADAAGLCLKSGNAVILKGGSEALHSNAAIADCLIRALQEAGLPEDCVQLIRSPDRQLVQELLKQEEYIDLIIPRGGHKLIRAVVENSLIPVIKHYHGVCHVFIDKDADLKMAREIAVNAKVQRPGVCNAMESLLIAEPVAEKLIPELFGELRDKGVEIRGCFRCREIDPEIKAAVEEDWSAEYLDLILSVKVVAGMEEAIGHIHKYGSLHTEAIVTDSYQSAHRFLREVDSSAVIVNASTRFNDGGEFGLGAEIGISTQKLHARGPMGLRELTCLKFIAFGEGQIRS